MRISDVITFSLARSRRFAPLPLGSREQRIVVGALVLAAAVGACTRAPEAGDEKGGTPVNATATARNSPVLVPCAHAGATLAAACTIDRSSTREALVLTLRHPDGAFRRLLVTRDGRGVVAADGAEPAHVTVIDPDTIEVAVAGDRYRLPATVRRAR